MTISYASSRYASCTLDVIDRCVRAVAAGADLEHVLAGVSGLEVALVGQEALEGEEAIAWCEGDPWREHDPRWRDWALTVYAEAHTALAYSLHERKQPEQAEKAEALWHAAIEAAAASAERSPMLDYHDVYFDAAQSLVRRGDRTGIVRQVENLAEALRAPRSETSRDEVIRMVLRDLALFHLDLGEQRPGLALLAAVLRQAPKDVWTHNVIAMRLAEFGLPTIAHLAAERGLALVRRTRDREDLGAQLRDFSDETAPAADHSDAPADAVEELRDALDAGFAGRSRESAPDLALRLVPAVATARVKQLPSRPGDEDLARTAEGLRRLFGARLEEETPAGPEFPEREHPTDVFFSAPSVQRIVSKVGRNEPCPCGSGKKHKKCCLG